MIVPHKKALQQVKFRWEPELVEELKAIAQESGRSDKETSELLMRWAVDADIKVPPKSTPSVVHFWWSGDVVEKLKAIAATSGRSENEVGELLMREAIRKARAEFDQVEPVPIAPKDLPKRTKK